MKQIKNLKDNLGFMLVDLVLEYNLFQEFLEQLDYNFDWEKVKKYKTSTLAER